MEGRERHEGTGGMNYFESDAIATLMVDVVIYVHIKWKLSLQNLII